MLSFQFIFDTNITASSTKSNITGTSNPSGSCLHGSHLYATISHSGVGHFMMTACYKDTQTHEAQRVMNSQNEFFFGRFLLPTSCSSKEERRLGLSVQASSPRDVRCARMPAAKQLTSTSGLWSRLLMWSRKPCTISSTCSSPTSAMLFCAVSSRKKRIVLVEPMLKIMRMLKNKENSALTRRPRTFC